MEQRNCKNCGAPLEHSYNHKCEYCGTLYDFNEPQEKVIEVKPEDLINIQLRSIERAYTRDSLMLLFDGYKCAMPKVYEYNSDNIYVSKVEEYVNPPKCGFCIELPIFEIREYGLPYIMHRIEATGVRYNELDKIKSQIQEKLYYFR